MLSKVFFTNLNSNDEKTNFLVQIHENLLHNMQHLISLVPQLSSRTELYELTKTIINRSPIITSKSLLQQNELELLLKLWKNKDISFAFEHSSLQFADNVQYFYNRLRDYLSGKHLLFVCCNDEVKEKNFSFISFYLLLYEMINLSTSLIIIAMLLRDGEGEKGDGD